MSALAGVAAFAYPFLLPEIQQVGSEANLRTSAGDVQAPIVAAILISVSLLILLLQAQGEMLNAKVVASLGALVAVAAALRFLENALPGPGGFSPVFVPIILCGYVFGGRYGLLMGALTILVSALVTGGVGPWLPYQMYLAAWIGLSSGWLPKANNSRVELFILSSFSFFWGVFFGVVLNLYFWPFLAGDAATTWEPGTGLIEAFGRYGIFYLGTSLLWDLMRAAGNVALMVVLGVPAVRALERFKYRFNFELV